MKNKTNPPALCVVNEEIMQMLVDAAFQLGECLKGVIWKTRFEPEPREDIEEEMDPFWKETVKIDNALSATDSNSEVPF